MARRDCTAELAQCLSDSFNSSNINAVDNCFTKYNECVQNSFPPPPGGTPPLPPGCEPLPTVLERLINARLLLARLLFKALHPDLNVDQETLLVENLKDLGDDPLLRDLSDVLSTLGTPGVSLITTDTRVADAFMAFDERILEALSSGHPSPGPCPVFTIQDVLSAAHVMQASIALPLLLFPPPALDPGIALDVFSPLSGTVGSRNEFTLFMRIRLLRLACRITSARVIVFEGVATPVDDPWNDPQPPPDPTGRRHEANFLGLGPGEFRRVITNILFPGVNTIRIEVGSTAAAGCGVAVHEVIVAFLPGWPSTEFSGPIPIPA